MVDQSFEAVIKVMHILGARLKLAYLQVAALDVTGALARLEVT